MAYTQDDLDWMHGRGSYATAAQELIIDDTPCELCGEPADAEMGEFTGPDGSVIAHALCGYDAEYPVA